MPNSWLYPVPEEILFESLSNARKRGTAFSYNEACLSYMLDRKKERVRGVREYSRLWQWPYSTTRRQLRRIQADVGKWATFYGASQKELNDPEKRSLSKQLIEAQAGTSRPKEVDQQRITSGSINGQQDTEKADRGSEVDHSRLTTIRELRVKKNTDTSSDSEESHVAPVGITDVIRYFQDKGCPEREAKNFYDYWEVREWRAISHTAKDKGTYVEITAGTWKRRAGTWIKNWRKDPTHKPKVQRGQTRPTLNEVAEKQRRAIEIADRLGLQ